MLCSPPFKLFIGDSQQFCSPAKKDIRKKVTGIKIIIIETNILLEITIKLMTCCNFGIPLNFLNKGNQKVLFIFVMKKMDSNP